MQHSYNPASLANSAPSLNGPTTGSTEPGQLPYLPAKRPKLMEKEPLLALRKKHIAPLLGLHYSKVKPLKIVYGRGQYLYDEQDQPYLDCINNVTHVGHCHPKVVQAGIQQMNKLAGVPDQSIEDHYTKQLLSTFPHNMGHVFYVTSGTEANDLALTIAEVVTGHTEVIVIEGAYHGHSQPLMGLSSYKMREEKEGVSRIKSNPCVWFSPLPDSYRGKYTDADTAGEKYAQEVKSVIETLEQKGKKLSSFLCESFPGCAGQVQLPTGYLKTVFDHVHKAGGVCIIDEVQTGFGRAGEYFWMFQHQGVEPDIVTVGKPMGNGHPVSAVITTERIARDFLEKCPHIRHEYTGDPVSLAIAEAVLTAVEEERLQEHARQLGEHIRAGLRRIAREHPCMGDVRGYGLFIGVEVVSSAESREPDEALAQALIEKLMLEHRVLIYIDGMDNNVLKIKPPLCFTRENAETILQAIEKCLSQLGH